MSSDGKLSPSRHNAVFKEDIEAPALAQTQPVKPTEQLTAIFLGGQPGSGKGKLVRPSIEELRKENTILIDVDSLRLRHPDYPKWQRNPATEKIAADLTHADASAWGKSLLVSAIENKRNIIIDGTLGNPVSAEKQIAMLKDAGYQVIVRALAVQPELSHLGVLKRFEDGKQNGEPRWVPPHVERTAYEGLPQTLHMAEKKVEYGAHVQVFDRNMTKLYDSRELKALTPSMSGARDALNKERLRPLNESELKTYAKDWAAVIGSMNSRKAPTEEITAAIQLAGKMGAPAKSAESKFTHVGKSALPDLLSMPATPASTLLERIQEPRAKSTRPSPK